VPLQCHGCASGVLRVLQGCGSGVVLVSTCVPLPACARSLQHAMLWEKIVGVRPEFSACAWLTLLPLWWANGVPLPRLRVCAPSRNAMLWYGKNRNVAASPWTFAFLSNGTMLKGLAAGSFTYKNVSGPLAHPCWPRDVQKRV